MGHISSGAGTSGNAKTEELAPVWLEEAALYFGHVTPPSSAESTLPAQAVTD